MASRCRNPAARETTRKSSWSESHQPNAERILFIRHVLRSGFNIEEIFGLTKTDRWFRVQIKEIVDFEEELASSNH